MFYLSKFVWLLLQPLSLAFLLVLAGLAAGLLLWRRVAMLLSAAGIAVLFITLFTSTGTVALQLLEARFPQPEQEGAPGCILVLGGGFEGNVTRRRGGIALNQGGERYVEALRLALRHPQAKVLVSGGDGSLTGGQEDDGSIALRLFASFGIADSRLIFDPVSRNTFENAENSASIIREHGLGTCLMITSAFHMPRAVGMMRKVGLPVIPWPVDYRTDGATQFGIDFTEPMRQADRTSTAWREWLGLLGNYAAGRIDSPFPAP